MKHHTTSPDTAQRRRAWTAWLTATAALALGTALLCVAAALLIHGAGEQWREVLRYQRDGIVVRHEYWRLLSGHLVHGDDHHLALNLLGLALIAALCRGCFSYRQWVFILLVVVLAIDLGLLFAMPQLAWYVGLSGVLHGVLAAGAVRWWRIESPWLAALLGAILVGKLVWEQSQGALPISGDLPVVVNAHLYGVLGGVAAALWLEVRTWLVGTGRVT